ncbi:MAG: AraC family transcriptional regulator [Phycisphaera sp.]|nr:MAG: AraC family transcriptional regulator [Phycisphaera sp.]
MDPNSVAYYSPNELYKRQLASNKGDLCGFISPSLPLLATILGEAGLDVTNDAPPFKVGPAVSWATAAHHKLAKSITDNTPPPDLVIESVLMEIARETILKAASESRRKPRQYRSISTSRAHADIARRTKEVMARSVSDTDAEQIRLEDISKQVHVSTYHLCRVFKQQTGESIAQHHLRLRLRAAAGRLAWSDHTITSIAHDFGFANHAHFTTAWKSEFGYPPSALRRTSHCFYDRARN